MGKNVTEQQRIAAALESMVDTSDSEGKKNVTEQQRIASALEAMAEGGGGGGGSDIMVVNFIKNLDTEEITANKTFDEVEAHIKNGGFAFGRDNKNNTYVLSKCVVDSYDDTFIREITFSCTYYFDGTNMGSQHNAFECRQYEMLRNGEIKEYFYQVNS